MVHSAQERVDAGSGLPGSDRVDTHLLDRVVAELNAIHCTRGLEYARQVACHVLRVFFRNRSAAFDEHGCIHASYRALASRPDLEMSYSTLHKCVAVELQIRDMPIDLALSISFTHHVVLLPVRDRARRLALARRASSEGLSSRGLRLLARRATHTEGPRRAGRPRLPGFVKGMRQVSRAVDAALTEQVTPADVERFGPERTAQLLADIDDQLARLEVLREEVQGLL